VRTLYRAVAEHPQTKRIKRFKHFQNELVRDLLRKFPDKSSQQIAEMTNAHIAGLSEESLANIMDKE